MLIAGLAIRQPAKVLAPAPPKLGLLPTVMQGGGGLVLQGAF